MSAVIPSHPTGAVPSATKGWSISVLVLSVLFLLSIVPNLFQWHKSYTMMGSEAPFWAVLMLVDVAISAAFVLESIAVLKGSETAREVMSYTAAAAIVAVLLGFGLSFCLHNDAHFASAMMSQMISDASTRGQQMTPAQAQQFVDIATASMFYGGLFIGVIQLVYCSLLYRHMSKEPTE